MKKIILLIGSLLICSSVHAQNKDLILFKLPDKKQTIKIKSGAWISFTQSLYTPDSLQMAKWISGRLNFAMNDSINMEVEKIRTGIKLESGIIEENILSKGGCVLTAFKTESYPISIICGITYKNKSGEFFTKAGTYLAVASLLTAAIVAPLVSINYQEGTFNLDTYKSVVIAGGIGFGVSIPILVISRKKRITLEPCNNKYVKKAYTHVNKEE